MHQRRTDDEIYALVGWSVACLAGLLCFLVFTITGAFTYRKLARFILCANVSDSERVAYCSFAGSAVRGGFGQG